MAYSDTELTEIDRPTPQIDDPEAVRVAMQHWLGDVLGTQTVEVSPVTVPDGNGMSNITLLFDIRYEINGTQEQRSIVGRLQAGGDKLVFPSYNLSLQYDFMRYLEGFSQVPSPVLLAEEPTGTVLGTPFYLMERTEGRVPTDAPA